MTAKSTPATFISLVQMSGLVDEARLQVVLAELRRNEKELPEPDELAGALVGAQLLTQWQAQTILKGRYKGFQVGKYKLLDLLGSGGMGSVYLAEHVLMRRKVAIKVLPLKRVSRRAYLQRFHREARAVAQLDHPNIVRAYDVDQDGDVHFLVMEYVDGTSLYKLVKERGPLAPRQAVGYIRQAAEGLQHAWEAGLVHRDIKPGNLLVDRRETVKLLDLGLARFFGEDDEEPLTTQQTEAVLGTVDYLAPEQALDSHSADIRADVYGLGCTMYFLLTGRPPFPDGTMAQRLLYHQTREPAPLCSVRPDLSASLAALVRKMMAKEVQQRYQTPAELGAALDRWLRECFDQGDPIPTLGITPPSAEPDLPSAALAAPTAVEDARAPTAVDSRGERARAAAESDTSQVVAAPLAEATDASAETVADEVPGDTGDHPHSPSARSEARVDARDAPKPAPPAQRRESLRNITATFGLLLLIAVLIRVSGVGGGGRPEESDDRAATPSVSAARPAVERAQGALRGRSRPQRPLVWVRAAGGEFDTLSAALGAAEAGQVIRVAGSQVFEESIRLDASFPENVRVEVEPGARATLRSTGDGPLLQLDGVSQFRLSGFDLQADGQPVAVVLQGTLPGVRLSDLTISGFTRAGVQGRECRGFIRSEVVIERVGFERADAAVGVLFKGADPAAPVAEEAIQERAPAAGRVKLRHCRFDQSLSAAVRFEGPAGNVEIARCLVAASDRGIDFRAGPAKWQEIALVNNTFFGQQQGIVFDHMPAPGSHDLTICNNLFVDLSGPAGLVEQGYDDSRMVGEVLTINGASHNWDNRAPAGQIAPAGLIPLFGDEGHRQPLQPELLSTEWPDADFLRPPASSPLGTAGAGGKLPPYIGALPPADGPE